MKLRKVTAAPIKPVEDGKFIFGTYNTPFQEINMLEAKRVWKFPIPRFLQKLRLAEWEAFQVWDGKYFIMCVVGVSHIAKNTMAEIYVYDEELDEIIFKDFALSKLSSLEKSDGLIDSCLNLKTDKFEYLITNDLGNSNTIKVSVKYSSFEIVFTGDHKSAVPLCYCMPFAKNRGLYSHKSFVKASGYMVINGLRINFSSDARMNIDDHKGYYPFNNSYDWMTASTKIDNYDIGISLTRNQILDPEVNNENVIWVNGEINYLPEVEFIRHKDVKKEWQINDKKGYVNLIFTPSKHNIGFYIKKLFGLVLLNYYTPIGHLSGTVKVKDNIINFNNALGVGEKRIGRI